MNEKISLIIDQSSKCCGYAVLDGDELIDHGNLISKAKSSALRTMEFYRDLQGLVTENDIEEVVFEEIHYHGLKASAAIEALAGGALICKAVAEITGLPWFRVRPPEWKAACGIRGKNSAQHKLEARKIACQRWDLHEFDIKSDDHSDALCIAAYWVVVAEHYRIGRNG